MAEPALKASEIEGLRELISQVILKERDNLLPVTLLQDVEEVRRSPAGAVIRMEGKIDRLDEGLSNLQGRFDALLERVATKEDMTHLSDRMDAFERRMATKEDMAHLSNRIDAIEERMATKEDVAHLSNRIDTLEERMATKEDMAHLTDRMTIIEERVGTIEERMVTKEIMGARLAGIEKRLDTYDFWLKLFGGVLTALMIAQLVAAFVR
ncbi:MAG: hypothetical protein U9Q78_03785 [Chloroflexota bacterium]|nr:hypothetical protein [Chloroflexota bacterium]